MKKEKLLENSLRLLVFVIGIFSICIILLTVKIKVDAAEPSGELPYIVPLYRDFNSYISDAALESAINYYYANVPSNITINSFIAYTYDYPNVNNNSYRIYFITNPSIQNAVSSSIDYFTTPIRVNSNDYPICYIHVRQSDLQATGFSWNIGTWTNMLGNEPIVTQNNGLTTRKGYPIAMSGINDLYSYPISDGSGEPVLVFTNSIPVSTDVFQEGHAIEPTFDSDTIIDSGLHPNTKPTFPTINNYSFTTYVTPTLDTSSLENLVKSVYDAVVYNAQYLVSNYVGAINNFQQVVSDLLGYVGDLSSYLIQRVLNTIKQTSDNTYENFKGLLEPTLNSFANMINIYNTLYALGLKDGVFDIPTLFGALFVPNQSDLALFVDTFVEFDYLQTASVSIKSLLLGIFDVLNDDAVYSIHIQGFTYHGVSVPEQEISFDWYLPYKATGDIFISAFLIVGYLYWLFARISGIFHGMAPDANMASVITEPYHPSGSNGYFDY